MKNISSFPFRVLIVDDEKRDWAQPMRNALQRLANKKITLVVDIACSKVEAENYLYQYGYHVVSLDMRLPERDGELVSVESGLDLARRYPGIGFPKLLIYSQMLRTEAFGSDPSEAISIVRIPRDQYAKPTGSDADGTPAAIEILTVEQWAERVFDYLTASALSLNKEKSQSKKSVLENNKTVVGSYLTHGINFLPPLLATHAATMRDCWEKRDICRIEAAKRFYEGTLRLAMVQSLVLAEKDAIVFNLTNNQQTGACLQELIKIREKLSDWNWLNYLRDDSLQALNRARIIRNDFSHALSHPDSQEIWDELLPSLRYIFDIAAYWVHHPLCTELKITRDGWTAKALRGSFAPEAFPRISLPPAVAFPHVDAAENPYAVWQHVWHNKSPEASGVSLNWGKWLELSSKNNKQWLLPIYRKNGSNGCIDIVTGNST